MATVKQRNIGIRSHFGADKSTLALATLYFALFNGDPEGAGVEPTATGGYARVAKTNDATLWGTIAGTAVQVANSGASGALEWPAASGVWSQAQVTHWAVFDNTSGGNLVYSGELASPIAVTGAGDIARIPAGQLVITQQ